MSFNFRAKNSLLCLAFAMLIVNCFVPQMPTVSDGAIQGEVHSSTSPRRRIFPDIPPIRMQVQQAERQIALDSLKVQVQHMGGLLRTQVYMTFTNPNARVLEGELQFPLTPNQTVTGFALDINGKLRQAVPVDKPRAQEVFEEITRRGVDPGVLQVTEGNNYKLRVYPLPAQGSRQVMIQLDERVDYRIMIPLSYAASVRQFELSIQLPGITRTPDIITSNELQVQFKPFESSSQTNLAEGGYSASVTASNVKLPDGIAFIMPTVTQSTYTTQALNGNEYFLLNIPASQLPAAPARKAPSQIMLVWDASGSGAQRNLENELALLDTYFKRYPNITVQFIQVADRASAPQRYEVRNGSWDALRAAINAVKYDGASNLSSVKYDGSSQIALWFTDGLANYGNAWDYTFAVPVVAISSSASVNAAALGNLAQNTRGGWIHLHSVDMLAALQPQSTVLSPLFNQSVLPQLQSIGATELQSKTTPEGLLIAGRLTQARASITLNGNGWIAPKNTFEIQSAHQRSELAATQWAQMQIDQLMANPTVNTAQLRRLGKEFGLVTPQTSLIVLELAQDYARYNITPPSELQAQVQSLIATQSRSTANSKSQLINRLVTRFETRQRWWNTAYPKDMPRKEEPDIINQLNERQRATQSGGDSKFADSDAVRPKRPPDPPSLVPMPSAVPSVTANLRASPATSPSGSTGASAMQSYKEKAAPQEPLNARIELKRSVADAPYLKRLSNALPQQWYSIYLDERKGYERSVSFYLDVAEFFFDKKQTDVALRVLSNLAEMDLENRQVLRLLAYRLQQAGQVTLAIPLFERVAILAPNEPQSHRDLGLAYAQANQPQRAIEKLYEVVSGRWDSRFVDIDLIALGEMNTVIDAAKRSKTALDTSAIDSRLIKHLPVDLRVVLAWDADNTDVDLHVIDPNGEEVFFSHQLSYQGGTITRDATGGYGPEEFMLRNAKPGKYVIKAVFYGHRQQVLTSSTGLMLGLYTGYGSAKQADQRTTIRVKSESQETVTIGQFVVK